MHWPSQRGYHTADKLRISTCTASRIRGCGQPVKCALSRGAIGGYGIGVTPTCFLRNLSLHAKRKHPGLRRTHICNSQYLCRLEGCTRSQWSRGRSIDLLCPDTHKLEVETQVHCISNRSSFSPQVRYRASRQFWLAGAGVFRTPHLQSCLD